MIAFSFSGLDTHTVSHNADIISFNENNERITDSICLPTPLQFFVKKNSSVLDSWRLDDSQNLYEEFKKDGYEPKGGKISAPAPDMNRQ